MMPPHLPCALASASSRSLEGGVGINREDESEDGRHTGGEGDAKLREGGQVGDLDLGAIRVLKDTM